MSVLTSRYLRRDSDGKICETAQQMFWRVASVISACDASTDDGVNESNRAYATALATEYYRMMTSLEFFPNSPTFTGAGTPLGQLAACFVLAIMDNMGQESGDGIFGTLKDAALIQQTGGGVGFSFSNLRPKGDLVRTSKGTASGPISFLKVYDAAFCAIAQGGTRRGANMAVLRVDHPDIEEFIACKATEGTLTNFNLSVGITDKFMEAVKRDGYFELVNPRTRKMSKAIKASELFGKIAECAHKNGEPGVLFLDTANESNPVPKIYTLEATNPCGEQFLGPSEGRDLPPDFFPPPSLTIFLQMNHVASDR
jgi:ribonucleoside-diphosphate reductase alpha chain